jgi:hypothetical protein
MSRAKWKRGDRVRVVVPELFVRCGYPADPAAITESYKTQYRDRIREFLRIDGARDVAEENSLGDWLYGPAFNMAARALTAQHIANTGFGGRERRIYTMTDERARGVTFEVIDWHFNKTGTYYAPNNFPGGWWDPPEYEPGGLQNECTHRILHLVCIDGTCPLTVIKIEECNVSRIEDT